MQVNIRQWRLSDAEDLAEALNDPSVLNNLRDGLPYPYTVSDAEEFISAMLSANRNDVFAFAITADGKTVGSIGVFRQGNIHCRTAETGYYINRKFWGQGVATAAVRKACEYVFENSDIIRIFAEPFADNAASCRVLEKSGFTQEGVLKCNAVKNGKIMDMKMYSLIKPSLD
ncbi:MAG: GNAT family N-acetyltransferase [Clostridia bacterium]|jgi:RimJ/RimL family protein N-acetyltransferase|nr:GNAT family N-acetyltransferase [Clostridia bacterium]